MSRSGLRDLERAHGAFEPGATWPLTAYHSKSKRLNALAGGGTLFMVTVKDGALWLVAALDNPAHDGKSWIAPPNAVPITDISALLDVLAFDTGKGLRIPRDKLAMSLQTPRILSDDDVLHLRAAGQPSPNSAYRAAVAAVSPVAPGRRALEASAGRRGARPATGTTARPTTRGPIAWTDALASVQAWAGLDQEARVRVARDVAAHLDRERAPGAAAELAPLPYTFGVARLAGLRHVPSGTELVIVPGGHLLMGLAVDDVHAIMGVFDDDELDETLDPGWASRFSSSRPPRAVAVSPFLVSRGLVEIPGDDPLARVAADGFRLISEAEWEWIAREGGAVQFVSLPTDRHPLGPTLSPPVNDAENGWGIQGLLNEEVIVADRWHDDYRGAPATSEPWDPGGRDFAGPWAARFGHTWWQGHEEALGLHAAARTKLARPGKLLRLARGLAATPAGTAPGWESVCEVTLATMTERDRADRRRAAVALLAQGRVPGPDSAVVLAAILDRFDDLPAARQVEVLGLVAPAGHDDVTADVLDARMDRVLALLAHGKPEVRACAAFLAAAARATAPAALERVRAELARERRHLVRASLVLALHTLSARLGVPAPELDELAAHQDPVVAAAATLALTERGPVPRARIGALALAAGVGRVDLPWYGGDMGARAQALLADAGPDTREVAGRAVAAAVRRQPDLAAAAVRFMFEPYSDGIRQADSLSPVQREVAEALGEPDWRARDALKERGLPAPAELGRWLGREPADVIHRPITVAWLDGERTWPLWLWVQNVRRRAGAEGWSGPAYTEAVRAGLSRLDPFDRLELNLRLHAMNVREPYEPPQGERGFFPSTNVRELLPAALAADRPRLLAYAEEACKARRTHARWAVKVLFDETPADEPLSDAWVAAVPFPIEGDDEPLAWWRRIARPERQRKIIATIYRELLEPGVSWSIIRDVTLVRHLIELTPTIARGLLALAAHESYAAGLALALLEPAAAADPAIAEVLADFHAANLRGDKRAHQAWRKDAADRLKTEGYV